MPIYSIIALIWVIAVTFAYPLRHSKTTDVQILAFAHVLEQLESAFYTQALAHFNASGFMMADFASSQVPIQQIETIASDESVHTTTLQSAIHALDGKATSNCTFNFSSALTSVDAMIATARVVENVGVSAYLGALALLADPALVTTASTILTVEARHQTILNLLSNATSIPQPFDVALTPEDVLAIVNTFISGCKLGFSANPPLIVTNNGTLQAGTRLNFSSPALNGTVSENQLSCKIVTGGSNGSIYQPADDCMVPGNVTGPMYVFITHDQTTKSAHDTKARNSTMATVAGPALLFVDQPDLIGSLIRPGLDTTAVTTGNITTSESSSQTTLPTAGLLTPKSSSGAIVTTLSPSQTSSPMRG